MQLEQITFTRFVAALTVVFFHYGQTVFPANVPFLFENVTAGPIAVGYFYVLSGFIMAIAYYQPERLNSTTTPVFHKKKYWIARFARIYPVYLVALFVIVAAKYKTLANNFETLPLHLSMLQAWIPGYPITLNTPGWSISVEAFFYLCFPFLLLSVYKSGTRKLVILTLIFWVATQLVLMFTINSDTYQPKNLIHDLVYYNPVMHFNSFLAGLLTGIFFKKNPKNSTLLNNHHANSLYLVLSFLLICLLIWARPYLENLSGIKIAFTNGLLAPAFLLFIVLLARDRSFISGTLRHKGLILLGEASYSLYILQKPLHGLYDKIIMSRIALSETAHFYIFLVLLILVSIASFLFFESPLRRYLRKRLS